MKNKSSDNTLNKDGLPERDQEPTEEGEIKLLDVVALMQEVPAHNLKRGEVGTVVEILSNGEAYEVEFSDDNGQMYKRLSFPASQLEVFHQEPIKADPKRQATDSLRGYRYQMLQSVKAWLELAENESLYLEGVEDFDIVSDDTVTLVQVKDTRHNVTLRSQEIVNAINHYWKLQAKYSNLTVKFRLLTRSKIGREQGNPFGNARPGLRLWNHCLEDEETIIEISQFLQVQENISDEVKDFLRRSEPQKIYEQLLEPITWETDSPDASLVEQSIIRKLVQYGNRRGVSSFSAEKVVDHLLKEVWMVAGQKENRKLTLLHFQKIFEGKTKRLVSEQYLQHLEMLAEQTVRSDNANVAAIREMSDVTIQPLSPIQTAIPPLYPDVFQRTGLLTSIQTKLQSNNIVVIHGGVDKGKTTLAKLAANAIDGSWCWLNLREKNLTQVTQLLQQLDIEINNQSSQINVVLDDLSLQPQQLQAYEEILGMVVYSVRAHGAKLLITSQHKPPNNFIRILGLSPSAIIDKLDFTMPEIEQFSQKMACPTEDVETWINLIQAHTGGHPRLVHALLTQLREREWKQQDIIENIFQTPSEVLKERESARQLLMSLPEDRREFLYRLSLLIEFRKDYAINIGEIPVPISHSGDIFSQLVGPWIDQVNETYYTISPLLKDAAREVWSESKIKELDAQIANSILKTKNLTTTEAWAVFTHSVAGQNREGIIAFIYSLMNVPQNDWKNLCQEFSWLVHIKIDSHGELFPGDAFVNQMFRSLQYRIAVEVRPELVPKIFEIWDKETKPYKPRRSYLLSRLMLATEVLRYNQVLFSAKKIIGYFKEMIDIKDQDKQVWQKYLNSMGHIEEHITDKSNYFSFLFSSIHIRDYINAVFLDELIDALDELEPRTRTLLLAEFEDYNIDCRILIENIYLQEEKQEIPDWTRCLQVYDKVIESSLAWGYPYIAALSARGKAIIHDEYLHDPDTAHKVFQDIVSKAGALPVIEEGQAVVYLRHGHYQEALDIYERILPEWHQSLERFGVGPLEEYRRAAICAAYLDDWKKAATFFEEGAKKTQKVDNTERYIGSYADAGFAHFKAGNMLNCIKFLHLALQDFETLPQDNTNVKYFTLKKRLEYIIKWIWVIWCGLENNSSELSEPAAGFCSDPETNEKVLGLPNFSIGYAWLDLAQIEYRFGHETTVFQHALQTTDQQEYPILNFHLSFLEAKYDFRNKIFDNLPQRIYQLAAVYSSRKKHMQSGKGAAEKGSYFISDSDLSDFASVDNIISIFVAALVVEMRINRDEQDLLAKWRANSSELPIKENIYAALDLMEPLLLGDYNNALTVLYTVDEIGEKQLTALIRVIYNQETSLEDLLLAHTIISSSFINSPWEDFVVKDLGILLSGQWLKKIEFRAALKTPMLTVPQIEKACKSSETGKKKIGQILLAVHQAVSVKVPLSPKFFEQFRTWAESEQTQEPAIRKNPTAQRLIKAMEKPPHLTDEDIEALNRSIKQGEIPIKFDSPFDSNESNK